MYMPSTYAPDNPETAHNAILVSEIEHLLADTRNFQRSEASQLFFETLVFIKKSQYLAPFNALLVKQQRPKATFVLPENRWHHIHSRKLRSGVQPIVVMRPFGPVDFVYDIADIANIEAHPIRGCHPNLPTEEICRRLFPSTQPPPHLQILLEELIRNCRHQGLRLKESPLPIERAGQVGLISSRYRLPPKEVKANNRLINYEMTVNSTHPTEIRFAALAHELAHIYCNHLNEFDRPQGEKNAQDDNEFEAEAVAYLFCYRHGFRPRSEQYLAGYLQEGREPQLASFGVIINALKKIEDLLKPPPFSDPPRQLEISIGGYMGYSYSLILNDGVLRYEECANGYQRLRTVDIVPTAAKWTNFWKSCHRAELWAWDEQYADEEICDGTGWSVEILLADREVNSHGSNDYPGAREHSDDGQYPPPFRSFLAAVSRLIGGLPFE